MRFFRNAILFLIAIGALIFGIYSDLHGSTLGIWISGATIAIVICGLIWAAVKVEDAKYETLTQQVIQRAMRSKR